MAKRPAVQRFDLVQYVDEGGECWHASVTAVNSEHVVSLEVIRPRLVEGRFRGVDFVQVGAVLYGDDPASRRRWRFLRTRRVNEAVCQ